MSNGLNTFPTNRVAEEAGATPTASGGAGFAFGLVPPKASLTFKEMRNTSAAQNFSITENRVLTDKGRLLPVIDTQYAGIFLPVLQNNGTAMKVARGKMPSGSADFSTSISVFPTFPFFCRAAYYSEVTNAVYMLMTSNDSSSSASDPKGIAKITVDAAGGTPVLLLDFDIDLTDNWNAGPTFEKTSFGNQIYPTDPANPDTSDWNVIYIASTGATIAGKPRIAVYSNAGGGVGTQQSLNNFTVDSGTQEVISMGGYVTEDKQIICSPFMTLHGKNGSKSDDVYFVLQRGASSMAVVVPSDGVITKSEILYDPSNFFQTSNTEQGLFVLWGGDTVAFITDGTDDQNTFVPLYGRRMWDRVDFDRWLGEVCDFLNMTPGEDFY